MENDLQLLGATLVDQGDLELSITRRANEALISKDTELDQKRLEKTLAAIAKVQARIRITEKRLNDPRTKLSQRKKLKDEIEWFQTNELAPLEADVADIKGRMDANKSALSDTQVALDRLPGETERDFLIRTGKITAFGNENAFSGGMGLTSRVHLRQPGFQENRGEDTNEEKEISIETATGDVEAEIEVKEESDEDLESESDFDADDSDGESGVLRNVDDGDELVYQSRLRRWAKQRSKLRHPPLQGDEWHLPHPTIPDAVLNKNFRLPGDIYPSLFDYQKTCVQWLWELYSQKTGGIIGDEMGLGKTIQIISFLAGLHYSGLLDKPVLVVVPATVLNQWVNEFHRWWPPLRCVILHSIGLGMLRTNNASEEEMEAMLETSDPTKVLSSLKGLNSQINAKEIVDRVMAKGHVLVTTYVGLRIYSKWILPREWGYCVLDEGHKIRNPDSDISLTCKQIKTYNRIILSGTPIQNNLKELWLLFDFVFPGRLGTLPVFETQFSVPINMGGYANASNVQVQTGYKCAVMLRDLISPYLLRRLKADVAQDLPKKNEMVLFVKLTQYQQDLYEKFLDSEDISAILRGKRNVLMGVDILRKICNHPDLVDREMLTRKKHYNYGNPAKSGKMQVLKNLLQLWQSQGHRTLLFCQTRQMLDILEKFVANLTRADDTFFTYVRMDGSTPIAKRQALVDTFNTNEAYDVFLLTTKVGGLGVNLTGADRVIIYDPDWNPSTDMQARERAWRLGQKKDITIYRFMTAGSIEEKIYHRQIFKTFLTNKILKDPKQRRFFKMNDLHDLFTLGDPNERGTETGDLFSGLEKVFGGNKERKSGRLLKKHDNDDDFYQVASIMGVSKLDEFEEGEEEKAENKDDNRIMESIFATSGVHSALQHEDIMSLSQQEVSLVEKEASRLANEAAAKLRELRRLARRTAIGTPTWTGKFGAAGKFGPKRPKVKALLSTAILSELKHKKESKFVFGSKRARNKAEDNKDEVMRALVEYLQGQEGRFASSNQILGALAGKVDVKDERETILVRQMLREVATWEKEAKGWRLKLDLAIAEERGNESDQGQA